MLTPGRITALLFAFVFSQMGISQEAVPCRAYFHVFDGIPTLDHDLPLTVDADVTVLGRSMGGGGVYRVRSPNLSPQTFKKYKDQGTMEEDLFLVDVIENALHKIPHPTFDVVEMNVLSPPQPKLVQVTNLEGEALRKVLQNKQISEPVKMQLIAKYNKGLDELFQKIKETYGQAYRTDQRIEFKTSTGWKTLIIHPGNVVVDPVTLRLTIIDPK